MEFFDFLIFFLLFSSPQWTIDPSDVQSSYHLVFPYTLQTPIAHHTKGSSEEKGLVICCYSVQRGLGWKIMLPIMELRSTHGSKREPILKDGEVHQTDKLGHKSDPDNEKAEAKMGKNGTSNDDRFDFDGYLKNGVPEHFTINVACDHDTIPNTAITLYSTELNGADKPLGSSYSLELVDVTKRQNSDHSGPKNTHWKRALRTQSERRHAGQTGANDRDLSKDPFAQKRNQMRHVRKPAKGWIDPLDDKLYDVAHRRKEMRERKFGAADRTKSLSEFDECMSALDKLGRSIKLKARLSLIEQYRRIMKQHLDTRELENMAKVLPELSKVNDPSDMDEVRIKYKLTVKELMKFIIKFEDIRSKEQNMKRMKTEIRQHRMELVVDTDDDEPTDPISLKEFTERSKERLRKRNRKHGKIIKVHFYNGVTLVIDPVYNPRIVRD